MKLLAVLSFTTVGVALEAGRHYDPSVTENWPEGALARRLNNGDVKFVNVVEEVAPEPEPEEPVSTALETAGEASLPDFSALSKKQLVAYAAGKFGTALDASLSKDELVTAVTALHGAVPPATPEVPAGA